jgi:PAS domain-containing protein
MSLNEVRLTAGGGRWRGVRFVIFAAAVLFAGLVLLGALTIPYAIAGLVIMAVAAILAGRATEEVGRLARPVTVTERAGERLDAVVAGLPDPVIALDRNGRVLTLNEHARMLAPALRQGDPVSLALRMPELIEAVSRAYASGEEQRVEYSERVPIDRWFELIVKPVWRESKHDRPHLVLMTFHDLTPLRRVEEMRADFVANASHELRTPLAPCPASSRRCRVRRATMPKPATVSSPSCRSRRGAWRGSSTTCCRCRASSSTRTGGPTRRSTLCRSCVRSPTACRNAGARPRRERQYRGGKRAPGSRRPRRAGARVREPDRERAQIRRAGQARRYHAGARRAVDRRGPGSGASACAITGRGSRRSTCRG